MAQRHAGSTSYIGITVFVRCVGGHSHPVPKGSSVKIRAECRHLLKQPQSSEMSRDKTNDSSMSLTFVTFYLQCFKQNKHCCKQVFALEVDSPSLVVSFINGEQCATNEVPQTSHVHK